MTPRETIEVIARALCKADYGKPDTPVYQGEFRVERDRLVTDLFELTNEWSPPVIPMWATYIQRARFVAVALGFCAGDDAIDFSDIPEWELVKKEAKEPK